MATVVVEGQSLPHLTLSSNLLLGRWLASHNMDVRLDFWEAFFSFKSPTLPQQKVYDAKLVKGSQGAPLYEPMYPCVCEN